jgi:hypothetical protein
MENHMKIALSEASQKQLADFAQINLGLEIDRRFGADKLRALIAQTGYSQPDIEVADVAEEPTPARIAQAEADAKRKKIKILIPNQETPGSTEGREPVPVGVNGRVVLIKRGVPVEVPEEYVHALQNANKMQYDTGPNGELINPTMVPTYPFSVLG